VALMLGHAARSFQIGLINHADAIAYDAKVRLTMPRGVDQRIAILDIDEKSLQEIGRWPWGRERMAQLVTKLFDHYGVAVLGFDVVFAEPDDSSGLKSLESLALGELRGNAKFQALLEELRPRLDHDRLFVQALSGRPAILGFYLSNRSDATGSGALPPPALPAGSFKGRNVAITAWSSHGGNLVQFQQAAAGGGHFNPLVDFDGVARRVPLIAEYQGNYYEALSLAIVRHLLGKPALVPGFPDEKLATAGGYAEMEWLDVPAEQGILRIPVDENAAALVPFRGFQGSFAYHSLADVLAGRVAAEQLKGRIALVGTTAPGLLDLRATPVANIYPGVEVHANLIAGMLDGTIKHKPSYVVGAEILVLGAAALFMVFLVPLLSPLRATLATAALLALLVAINLALWHYANLVLPLAAGVIMVLVLFALNMSHGYFVEARAKRQFTELFGRYVPPELVEEMSRDPERYSMDGRNAELTMLFADVRDFTSISEAMEPTQLTQLMNEYLTSMTAAIHHRRGTLDKYIGDAIMAFWGAPVADADHATHAVLACLEMQAALEELNRSLTTRGWPQLRIGVGINTGTVTVGDMGSTVRKAYTVMGDAVNLASRLEGITKYYGAAILVGEATRRAAKGVVFREIDRIRVKGKDEPVTIFEPLGFAGSIDRAQLDEIESWNQALGHIRARDWDQADRVLSALARTAPGCELYRIFMGRVAEYRRQPPAEDWDGVTAFASK
jgi:adenylate cyclase